MRAESLSRGVLGELSKCPSESLGFLPSGAIPLNMHVFVCRLCVQATLLNQKVLQYIEQCRVLTSLQVVGCFTFQCNENLFLLTAGMLDVERYYIIWQGVLVFFVPSPPPQKNTSINRMMDTK